MVNDMNYKSTMRKHGLIIAVCVLCSLAVVAGTSYALFFQTNVNSNNQVVKTGKLSVTYGNDKKRITLDKLLPDSDANGLSKEEYTSSVKIENTGSLPASYELKLSKDLEALQAAGGSDSNFVDLQYVKVAVYNGEERIKLNNEGDNEGVALSSLTATDGAYVLYTGTLAAQANTTMTVRIWLDASTPETETDKYIYFKLDVKSVVDEQNTEEGQTSNG